jgi:hypothetical protein
MIISWTGFVEFADSSAGLPYEIVVFAYLPQPAENVIMSIRAADKTRKPECRGQKIGCETPIFVEFDPVVSDALKAVCRR